VIYVIEVFVFVPWTFIRRKEKCLKIRQDSSHAQFSELHFPLSAPSWVLPFFLLLPTVVFFSEINKLKIQRQFYDKDKQSWLWGIRELFSLRSRLIIVIIFTLIQIIVVSFVQFVTEPLPADSCLQRAFIILCAADAIYCLILSYCTFKIFFVDDPYYLRVETITNFMIFTPIYMILIAYAIDPSIYPENFDIRIMGILTPFVAYP